MIIFTQNYNGVHVKFFFVAYEIHENIKESVVTFCLKNEIELDINQIKRKYLSNFLIQFNLFILS